ncbi:disks large-associated 1-like [Paramuricea clavata]|nr:disks large-associated 1-like [Paramuricea clavata]
MNGCVCVHGQDVLNRNPFYPMAKNDTSSSIPNGDEPSSPCRDEMFSVRSRILKTPAKNSNASVCNGTNGDLDNYIGEESSGVYFAKKLDEVEQRISKLCFAVQLQMWENSPPEEVKGKIRAATGKARLLLSSKFKQFKDLCDLNAGLITSTDGKIPTKTDLEGFWDLVMLQVVDVDSHFEKIEKLRKNNWIDVEPEEPKTPKSPTPKGGKISPKKKNSQTRANASSNSAKKSSKEGEAKKRQEARKRLAEAKKAARKRLVQSPSSDGGDVIICSTPPRKPES